MEDLQKFRADMKFVIQNSRHSAEMFKAVQEFEVKWYHVFYDKDLKALYKEYMSGYDNFMALQKRLQYDIKIKAEPTLEHQQQIKFGMLSTSGHLYAETGRLLKMHHHRAIIKCLFALNIATFFCFGYLTIRPFF